MSRAKQASKRNQRRKAIPVLGAAGLSLSLASAASGGPLVDMPTRNSGVTTKSILLKRRSLTSASQHFMSSTRKTSIHCGGTFSLREAGAGAAAVEVAVVAAVSGAAAAVVEAAAILGPAEAASGLWPAAAAEDAHPCGEVAAYLGEVAACAKS